MLVRVAVSIEHDGEMRQISVPQGSLEVVAAGKDAGASGDESGEAGRVRALALLPTATPRHLCTQQPPVQIRISIGCVRERTKRQVLAVVSYRILLVPRYVYYKRRKCLPEYRCTVCYEGEYEALRHTRS